MAPHRGAIVISPPFLIHEVSIESNFLSSQNQEFDLVSAWCSGSILDSESGGAGSIPVVDTLDFDGLCLVRLISASSPETAGLDHKGSPE